MDNHRILYIDKLKALAMLLVVMGHTIYFCTWHEELPDDTVFSIICTFHVPLFFFLSGFVISRPPSWLKFLVKARKFLVPMLVVGLINALLIDKVRDFFLNGGHNGYWYLLTLTIFYLLLLPFRLMEHVKGIKGLLADGCLAVAIWLLLMLTGRVESTAVEAFNPWAAYAFWPFFITGYISRKYAFANYITGKPWLAVILPLIYLVLLIANFSDIRNLPLLLDFTIALIAIAALFAIFSFFKGSTTFVDRQLLLIGNSTLDIYIYHYFFIRFIDLSFLKTSTIIIELLVIVPLTLAIAYGSIAIGKAVRVLTSFLLSFTHRSRYLFVLTSLLFAFYATPARCDYYDDTNFIPSIDTTKIDHTNLPIVFIDTSCGDSTIHVIHKDYRIAARMKIISNADGINYGDTIAHPDQTVDYEGWIAIRYRGNTSLTYSPKKPYNFKTMKGSDIDGEKQKVELLGMPKDNTWVLLAPYGDRSLLRDVMVFQLARPWFDYTPRCRYCEMILDGVYVGIYILGENIRKGKHRLNLDDPGLSGDSLTGGYQIQIDRDNEPHFTSKYLAVNSSGKTYTAYNKIYLQYKHPDYEDMESVQMDYIQRRVDQMEDVLASDGFMDPDTGYCQYLDPMSFIDQQLSQEFSGNIDGYRLSTNIYKHRDSQDPRFKTALWDFDLAFANSNSANAQGTDFWRYQNNYITNYNAYNKVPFWWMRLMEDPNYVVQLKERWAQYRQSNYSNEHIEVTIDSITSLLRADGALERNNTTWSMFKSTTYDMEIDRIKQWIRNRVAWMDEQLEYNSSGIFIPYGEINQEIVGYYNLQGKRLPGPQKGLIIVKYKDGKSRKIVIQ